jgi:hypothetical protein
MCDTRTSVELLDRSIPVAPMPAIALHPSVAERFPAPGRPVPATHFDREGRLPEAVASR